MATKKMSRRVDSTKRTESALPDESRISEATKQTIEELGYDIASPHIADTPARVARFLASWHTVGKDPPKLTQFPSSGTEVPLDEVVIVRDITFYSLCAHHMLPFFGKVSIGYIPGKTILGLSKFARVVDHFAHRLQTQEQFTQEVGEHLVRELAPKALGVVANAEHLCMAMRGVSKPGAVTSTSWLSGVFRDVHEARAEFLSLVLKE